MSEFNYDRLTTAELFLAAICAGVARWEPFSHTKERGEVCVRGCRWTASVKPSGLPDLDDHPVRCELIRALEEAPRE